MSHSERCLSANRFGDGFDCICEPDPCYLAGYAAGLRRAQELAKEHLAGCEDAYGLGFVSMDHTAFDQAIDAEAAKVPR